MQRRMAWVGLFTVAIVLAACSEAPSRGELVQALEASGMPAERAACAADAVLDELSEDEVIELVERGPAGAPRDDPDDDDDSSDRVRAALAACQQVGSDEGTTPADEGTTPTTEGTEPTSTNRPG